jgi:hypothetical protein
VTDGPDGGWSPGGDLFDPATGRPRLLSGQCSDCVGRPGNLMHLDPGRLKELVEGNTGDGRLGLICHQTLPWGARGERIAAYCRWFYDHYGHLAGGIRIFERIGGFTEVPPPDRDDEHPGGGR